MAIKVQRQVYRLGKSKVITLPPAWLNFYGDRVNKVTIVGESILLVVPEGLESQAEKLLEGVKRMEH